MKDYEVHWKTYGTTIVEAGTPEEAMKMVECSPYEYVDIDPMMDHLTCVKAEEYNE